MGRVSAAWGDLGLEEHRRDLLSLGSFIYRVKMERNETEQEVNPFHIYPLVKSFLIRKE